MSVTNDHMRDAPARTGANTHANAAAAQSPLRPNPPPPSKHRWWIRLVLKPLLLLAAGVLVILMLAAAQKFGWISEGGGSHSPAGVAHSGGDVRYICPMMCTPPQSEPGRCPVCAMELVPAASASGGSDGRSVEIDPAARRVANIRTEPVKAVPLIRRIRAIGELSYDEGNLKTISAYVDGRIDRLYADYTGMVVKKGDQLALLYSPQLYSSQVELLLAGNTRRQDAEGARAGATPLRRDLYASARTRLLEFGMTEPQLEQLERAGEANSRMHLHAPISGTVIEKHAVEGQYVKTGEPIYRLADLSTVWLMLELFPDDAATVRYGQEVQAEVQSLPGRKFTGRVAFVDPSVKSETRTVGVRVVMLNEEGLLRVGDYAKASIDVQIAAASQPVAEIYDPELAGKWISPRHPHVIESSPGNCRVCGVALVPAAAFGFTSQMRTSDALVVPRSAVLMTGRTSVVYVETEPGRFEIRRVVLGPTSGDEIAILEGVAEGEQVAVSGNFLIDSQMQLAGNPSLIDPARVQPRAEPEDAESAERMAAFAGLSPGDGALALRQGICPVTEMLLGSMGAPIKVDVGGTPVFICCEGCRDRLLAEPARHLAKLAAARGADDAAEQFPPVDVPLMGAMMLMEAEAAPDGEQAAEMPDHSAEIAAALDRLGPDDRELAERQRICPVAQMPLGSMGTPIKVDVRGTPIFICCEGCRESLLASPDRYLDALGKEASR